jgi:hypothetical protein
MKISFKIAILSVVAGAFFVAVLLVGAPIALGLITWVTRDADPTEAEICSHLHELGADVPDCPAWLTGSKEVFGEFYDNRLRCYRVATSIDGAKRCDEPIGYMAGDYAD